MMVRKTIAVAMISLLQSGTVWSAEVLTTESVTYTAAGLPLNAVLSELHDKAGIEFVLAEDLKAETITADLHGREWQQVVRNFLSDYNYVATVGSDGTLRQVRISSRTFDKADAQGLIASR